MMGRDIDKYANGLNVYDLWTDDNNQWHRIDGPAYCHWNSNGVLKFEIWCFHGAYHRDDGPALREWNRDGVLMSEKWWINGRDITSRIKKIADEFNLPFDWSKWTIEDRVFVKMMDTL